MLHRKDSGFVLQSCVLPLGIGALLFSIVGPGQSSSRVTVDQIAANERAAIAALRSIFTAQAKLAASGAIDTDADGVGEYGYLGELAGTAWLRVYDRAADSPGIGRASLNPPLLPPDFGEILFDRYAENALLRNGYLFKVFLPDIEHLQDVDGIAEDGASGVGGTSGAILPDPDTGESMWCCYAWPLEGRVTGHRAFFVNEKGRILQTRNNGSPTGGPVYAGLSGLPDFDAAYSDAPETPGGLTGMGAPLGNRPRSASDGNVWAPIGR